MKIIDTHAHIFPEKIASKATHVIGEFYSVEAMADVGSSDKLLESGEKAGITQYLVFSTATVEKQVKSINDFIISEAEKHKEFIPVGTMHVDFKEFEEEIERINGKGIKGIKLHPDFQKFNFDDERMNPIYKLLEEKDMFVVTHSGDYRHGFSHPLRVAKIAEKFKKLRIIAAHCGGWSQWAIARDCLALPNVYVDTSSSIGFSKKEVIHKTIETFGEEKIFFGTDFPMWKHDEELKRLYDLKLKEDIMEKILYKNFEEFYDMF